MSIPCSWKSNYQPNAAFRLLLISNQNEKDTLYTALAQVGVYATFMHLIAYITLAKL